MFTKMRDTFEGEDVIIVGNLGKYSLSDTLECGQAFRYEEIIKREGYIEYLTVVRDNIIRVAQRHPGELIFFGMSDEVFERVAVPYFSLETDYEKITESIREATDSEWMKRATECGAGIAILSQDGWEVLFSFIISQNNNIPRIRKIIRAVCRAYGRNLAERNFSVCPLGKHSSAPCDTSCAECGICYSFPSAEDVTSFPERLLPTKPGFRYKYLVGAAEAVSEKLINLDEIKERGSFDYTVSELKKIKGVGDKVAACTALFGFENLEAFPIDVWMKKAINDYFSGHLDPKVFGKYAGIAQQYIFHYIRNIENRASDSHS